MCKVSGNNDPLMVTCINTEMELSSSLDEAQVEVSALGFIAAGIELVATPLSPLLSGEGASLSGLQGFSSAKHDLLWRS
jgi:hypothetical protein